MFNDATRGFETPRWRPQSVLVVLSFASLSVSVMQTMMIPLLPELPRALAVTSDEASWLVTATVLAGAIAMPSITRLADMFGKRRMILVCLLSLFVGSVIGIVGSALPTLIAARVLQGCALALIPVAMSILRDELPPERLAGSVAFISGTMGLGGAIGLPLTGIVFNAWGWHSVFWLAALMAFLGATAVLVFVPESPVRTGGRFDILGATLLSTSLLLVLLGITRGNHWGWMSARTLGAFALATGVLALWIPWQLRCRQPLVDLRTSGRRAVSMTNLAALLTGFVMFSNMLSTTQQLQAPTSTGYGQGLGVFEASIALIPIGLIFVLVAPLAAAITRRYGAKTTLIAGSVIMGLGFAARLALMSSALQLVLGASIVSVGMTLSFSAFPVLILKNVPLDETAAANGLNSLLRTVGLAMGSAAIAAVLSGATEVVNGVALPSESAFLFAFVLSGVVSFAACAAALGIPREAGSEAAVPAANMATEARAG